MKELIVIQKELKVGKNNQKQGIQFKYRTTSDILERVKPICHKNDVLLIVTDEVVQIGESNYIKSTATVIKGGDKISCSGLAKEPLKLMSMSAPQITGSCSSYARKTALCGLFAIDDNEDPDSIDNKKSPELDMKTMINNAINHPNVTTTQKAKYIADLQGGRLPINQSTLDKICMENNI